MPLCKRLFCCIFGWCFYIEFRLKYEKVILLSSSRAFSLSTPTFSLSTPVENSEATWKRATKCNKTRDRVQAWKPYALSRHTKTRVGMRKTRDRVRAWKPHALTKSTSNQLRFFQISSKVTKTSDKMQVVASNHRGDRYARRCTKIFRYLNPIPTRGKEEILPTI